MSVQMDEKSVQFPDLEAATPQERVHWAADKFGDELIMTTSFGTHSAVMLHLVTSVIPGYPGRFH